MDIKKKDKKLFWKLLDKLEMRKNDVLKNYIPASKWNDHFKNILINQNEPVFPQDSQEQGPLDYLITKEELKGGSYILKPNKSSASDCLSNEMISGLLR